LLRRYAHGEAGIGGCKLFAMTQTRRILMWLMLIVLAALVSYVGFRGYLTPEMLFNFANSFYC
jgi:hypothetical protein